MYIMMYVCMMICMMCTYILCDDSVVYLVEVFTIGARNPLFDMQKKVMTKDFFCVPNGMRTQFVLGSLVRKKYVGLFGSKVEQQDYHIFISNSSTSFTSAQVHAIGLSPYEGPSITSSKADIIQPPFGEMTVPYQSAVLNAFDVLKVTLVSDSLPDVFMEKSSCSYYGQLSLDEYLVLEKKLAPVTERINQRLSSQGVNCQEYFGDQCIKNGLAFNFDLNLTHLLYDYDYSYYNTNGVYFLTNIDDSTRTLMKRASLLFRISKNIGSQTLARIINNNLVRGINELFNLKRSSQLQSAKKYTGFSTNETLLLSLLVSFNQTSIECLSDLILKDSSSSPCVDSVPFSSNIVYEMIRNKDFTNSIRVLFNNKPMDVCGTQDFTCDMSQFEAVTQLQSLDPISMHNLCTLKNVEMSSGMKNSYLFKLYCVVLTICAVLGIILTYLILLFVNNKTLKENYITNIRHSNMQFSHSKVLTSQTNERDSVSGGNKRNDSLKEGLLVVSERSEESDYAVKEEKIGRNI